MKIRAAFSVCILAAFALMTGCMTARKADEKAIRSFEKQGIALQAKRFTSSQGTVHYMCTGNESLPSLIFLHGSPSSWRKFDLYLADEALRKKFHLISVYRPGFEPGAKGRGLNLSEQSDIIRPLVESLQQKGPVFIAGHSLGAPLAMRITADMPQQPHTVIGMSTPLDPQLEPKEKWRLLLMYTPLRLLLPGIYRRSNDELWFLKEDLVRLKQDLPCIQTRVWMIHGDRDRAVVPGNLEFGEKMLNHACSFTKVIIRKGIHSIPSTHFAEIRDLLLQLY